MEYRKSQLDEILFLIKKGFGYNDLLSMPVYVRRYFVDYILEIENTK
jgi:hypothetical protein